MSSTTEAEDPPSIAINDEDTLYRRIFVGYIRKDGSISPKAFQTNNVPDNAISVDLARLTTSSESSLRGRKPPYAVGCLEYRLPRSLGFLIRYRPTPNEEEPDAEENPAHCVLEGQNNELKCDDLVNGLMWVRRPPVRDG